MSRIFIDAGYAAERLQGIDPSPALLESSMESACCTLERHLGRRILEATYSAYHSGSLALCDLTRDVSAQSVLYLADPVGGFALGPVTDVTTLVEDGIALSVGRLASTVQPFNTALGAMLQESDGRLVRVLVRSTGFGYIPRSWASGHGNIRVVCKAGYPLGSAPAEWQECARELTWLFYKEGIRSGVESMQDAGASMQFIRTLPNIMQRTLNLANRRGSPSTLAG